MPAPASMSGMNRSIGRRQWLGLLALVLLALNLRPLFSSLSAVMLDLGPAELAESWKPLASSLPVLLLGVGAPLGARILSSKGTHASILLALSAVVVGTAMRGMGHPYWLIAGGCIAALGIAVGNVTLPSLVRERFDQHIGFATGAYTAALCAGASAAALLTPVILQLGSSRPAALAVWAFPAVVALLVWLFQPDLGRGEFEESSEPPPRWLPIAFMMGGSSALTYCMVGWLVPILQLQGISLGRAGAIASVAMIAQVPGCLATPVLATNPGLRLPMAVALAILAGGSFAGYYWLPQQSFWAVALVQGTANGGLFSLAMSLIAYSAGNRRQVAALSGQAQTWGYIIAAAGPQALGWLIASQPAAVPLFLAFLGAGAAVAGAVACRPRPRFQPSGASDPMSIATVGTK